MNHYILCLTHTTLAPMQRLVLLALVAVAEGAVARVTLARLVMLTGASENAVRRGLAGLAERGYVVAETGQGASGRYRLTFPTSSGAAEPTEEVAEEVAEEVVLPRARVPGLGSSNEDPSSSSSSTSTQGEDGSTELNWEPKQTSVDWAIREYPQVDRDLVTLDLLDWCEERGKEPTSALWRRFVVTAASDIPEPASVSTIRPDLIGDLDPETERRHRESWERAKRERTGRYALAQYDWMYPDGVYDPTATDPSCSTRLNHEVA